MGSFQRIFLRQWRRARPNARPSTPAANSLHEIQALPRPIAHLQSGSHLFKRVVSRLPVRCFFAAFLPRYVCLAACLHVLLLGIIRVFKSARLRLLSNCWSRQICVIFEGDCFPCSFALGLLFPGGWSALVAAHSLLVPLRRTALPKCCYAVHVRHAAYM